MALTVEQSWKMRKKIVKRPRTYAQALAIWNYAEKASLGSTIGGYHNSLGESKVRQYPLVAPYWNRTYVGMLPGTVNASTLDHTMYTNNDQVPKGRIAFYYAPSGGWGPSTRLQNSLELVLWLPDGRCLINPGVMESFQWGRRTRAEHFADVSLWTDQTRSCIRTRKDADGHVPSLWRKMKRPIPAVGTSEYRYSHHNKITDADGNETGMYWSWGKNYDSVYLWDAWTPLVIPKNRRQRPYLLRGVADRVEAPGAEPIPRLGSWLELRRAAAQRANVHRKMAGRARTLRHSPDHLRYFTSYFRSELGLGREDRTNQATSREPVARPTVEFLDAGSRHKRRVFLDE